MKKIVFIIFFSAIAFWFGSLFSFISLGHTETITIRADLWCPYNCDPDSDMPGYIIEIARQIFEKAGNSVDYQILNWARAIEETRQGNFDAIVGAYKHDAPDFVFPESAQGQAVDMFYTTGDSLWRYTSSDSLAGTTIGIIKDYSYGEKLDTYIKKNPNQFVVLHGSDVFSRNIKMLLLGRTTALIANKSVMDRHFSIERNLTGRIVEAGIATVENVYIAFSPGNPRSKIYARILSDGIATLRTSGELKKILEKYKLTDWQTPAF